VRQGGSTGGRVHLAPAGARAGEGPPHGALLRPACPEPPCGGGALPRPVLGMAPYQAPDELTAEAYVARFTDQVVTTCPRLRAATAAPGSATCRTRLTTTMLTQGRTGHGDVLVLARNRAAPTMGATAYRRPGDDSPGTAGRSLISDWQDGFCRRFWDNRRFAGSDRQDRIPSVTPSAGHMCVSATEGAV
jgi:hypothetical protein